MTKLAQLVRTITPDGGTLDGALTRPTATGALALDAVALLHGTGGNFYSSTFFELLANRFVERGVAALRGNTRGHDGLSTFVTTKGMIRLGAAYEIVDDCRHDVAGWVAWLQTNVGPRVLLLGHSLGAVKCLYAVAHEADLQVAGIVAISPPRLSYSWFCQSERAATFLETYQKADALVQAGQGNTLLEVKLPLPFVITAAGYVEKYGPDERYNFLNFLHAVRCPTLFLFGAKEIADNAAFQGSPDEVRRWQPKRPNFTVEVIADADHFYTGVREAARECIEAWLTKTTG